MTVEPQEPGCSNPQVVLREIETMLQKQAIEQVPDFKSSPGFYSRLFVVAKPNGKWRPIIDLSTLNTLVLVQISKSCSGILRYCYPDTPPEFGELCKSTIQTHSLE